MRCPSTDGPLSPLGGRGEKGSATAETALALPSVMLVLAALLGVGQVVVGQIRCVDAARAGARVAARGEPTAQVRGVVGALAPPGATVGLVRAGGLIRVVITGSVALPDPFPPLPWRCEAVAAEEAS